jgi:hypothetical protein
MPHVQLSGPCLTCIRMLKARGAPRVLIQLVAWAYIAGLVEDLPMLDAVEFFAGQGAVTSNLQMLGYSAYPFERDRDPLANDFCNGVGFGFAIALVLRVRPGGFIWLGIVCSSWVFMSRGSTGRHVNKILGVPWASVLTGNLMVSRAMLLLWLADSLGHFVTLKQPVSSLLPNHPRVQATIPYIPLFECHVFLGHFRAESRKLVALFSNRSWLGAELDRSRLQTWLPRSQNTYKLTTRDDGSVYTSGDKALKSTQTYPFGFGRAVALAYHYHIDELRASAEASLASAVCDIDLEWLWAPVEDPWLDAILLPVFVVYREIARARGSVL